MFEEGGENESKSRIEKLVSGHGVYLKRMSSYYKRVLTRTIAKTLSKHAQVDRTFAEKQLWNLINVQSVLKNNNSINNAQFSANVTQLADVFGPAAYSLKDVEGYFEVYHHSTDFIRFKVDPHDFSKRVLHTVRRENSHYGYLDNRKEKLSINIEFSSPNIAKPFHVGHLRSTILGNAIANLYEAAGNDVKRINFLGDWGTQFGLLALGLQRYSNEEKLKADPLLELFNAYVRINGDVKSECGKNPETTSQTYQEGMTLFAQLEKGDKYLTSVWSKVRALSMEELNKMYERLGVHFTHIIPESDFQERTSEVLQQLRKADLLSYDVSGVGYVQLESQDNVGRAAVVKSDGSSLYLTRDLAAALDREHTLPCDVMHYIVELGQRGHFTKLVTILNQLGVSWARRPVDNVHIRFGRVKGMSTRLGTVVFLRDVLDEAKSRVMESMAARSTTRVTEDFEKVADNLAVSSIILQDLKSNRANDYTFSWEKMLSMKADSGVFVQYCHARLCNLLSASEVEVVDDIDISCLDNDIALQRVILHLARYPDIFEVSLSKLEPHHIVQYTFKLCHLINSAYASCAIKGQSCDIAQARLLVFECSRQVLANCLQILGLHPLPEV